jgi:hypothetical protein
MHTATTSRQSEQIIRHLDDSTTSRAAFHASTLSAAAAADTITCTDGSRTEPRDGTGAGCAAVLLTRTPRGVRARSVSRRQR